MADLLNIGTSGLLANQVGIATTGHNIANSNVEGYSRQQTVFETQIAQRGAGGFQGSGVLTQQVRRVSDQFLNNQLRRDIQEFSSHDTFVSFVSQLESLVSNEQAGLASGLQNFFAAVQVAGEDPASLTARQQILSEAQNLTTRFNTLYDRVVDQSNAVNTQIELATEQINALGQSIAGLNEKIAIAIGQSGGASPNDLLDKRDIAISELSSLVAVNTSVQDGDQINVFIGKGQALVVGTQAASLSAQSSSTRPGEKDILIAGADITNSLEGGSLGAMLRARGSILAPTLNTMGQIAIGLSAELNAVQERGIDLFGQQGQALFADVNSEKARLARALPSQNNNSESNGVISVSIEDVSQLTTEDYVLDFTGPGSGNYTLSRAANGETVASGNFSAVPATFSTADGFNITLESGAFFEGDRVLIQPTRDGSKNFDVALSRPENLAFAQAVRTGAAVHNVGSGGVSQANVLSVRTSDGANLLADFATSGQLSPPLLVRFDSPSSYSILDNSDPNNPIDLVPAQNNLSFVPGSSNSIFPSDPADPNYRGYVFSIDGDPQTGDEFFVEFNSNGIGDSRNALALADVQSVPLLNRGVHSFTEAYSGLVQGVAAQVGQAKIDRDASEALMNQTRNARDSVSGVNLDEEAARLIQLEQAYNASAQVISIARSIFDTLLSAVR